VGKLIDNLLRFDLLIVDEVGFAPLDETGTQLFFRLVAGAYERSSPERSVNRARPERHAACRSVTLLRRVA
ncbi:MAG: ATP-binding protein, partial [Acidimicrobiales bacterium]